MAPWGLNPNFHQGKNLYIYLPKIYCNSVFSNSKLKLMWICYLIFKLIEPNESRMKKKHEVKLILHMTSSDWLKDLAIFLWWALGRSWHTLNFIKFGWVRAKRSGFVMEMLIFWKPIIKHDSILTDSSVLIIKPCDWFELSHNKNFLTLASKFSSHSAYLYLAVVYYFLLPWAHTTTLQRWTKSVLRNPKGSYPNFFRGKPSSIYLQTFLLDDLWS